MAGPDVILRRARSGIRQLIGWYLSPIGLLFGLVLLTSLVLGVAGAPEAGIAVLVLGLGVLVPWKFVRQTAELRAHVAASRAGIEQVEMALATTPTFDEVDASMRAVRKDTRATIRNMRSRLVDQRVAQNRALTATKSKLARTDLSVRSLEASSERAQTDLDRSSQSIASLEQTVGSLQGNLEAVTQQLDQLRAGHERVLAELEEEKTTIISDGAAQHYFLAPGYRRRSEIVANFDDTSNEDEWQREVYDYALGVAHQAGAKRVCDFGAGSGFKLMTRFQDFETVGIDVPETVEFLKTTYPDRTWLTTGELTPEMFDGFDLVIASDVIEHLPEPDALLDALARSNAKNIVLSTPARELLIRRGDRPLGPPKNPHHFLEWTMEEFRSFVSQYLDVVLQRVSNESQSTQLLHARRR